MKLTDTGKLFFLILAMLTASLEGQELNKTDRDGRKQGHWIKKYPNGNIMYEGYFMNDMPSGEFKRYYEDNTLKSVLVFSSSGSEAEATLYYPNGFVASKGKYLNQLKEGNWQFFSMKTKGLLISEEIFVSDKRNGNSITYYPDSTVADKSVYKNGLRHGEMLKYYPSGKLNLRANYSNGRLDGKFEAFFENGIYEMTGRYKNDLREGEWIIFRKDGSQRFRINYLAGVPDNHSIDIYETEYIDSLEKIKVKIADPDKTGEIW